MKQRRINATLKRVLPPIAALALTALLILTALPQAGTAAPTVASLSTNPKRINESAAAHSFIRSPFVDSIPGTTTPISAALRSAPVMFIENVSQFDDRVRFQVHGKRSTVNLAEDHVPAGISPDNDWYPLLTSSAQGTASPYDDEFNSPTLDPKWSWIREDPSHWSLTENPGHLRIVSQRGGFAGGGDVKNILIQPAPAGDFEATTEVAFLPTKNWQTATIIVYENGSNFFYIGRRYHSSFGGCIVGCASMEEGSVQEVSAAVSCDLSPTHLKVKRSGNRYQGLYQEEGGAWIQVCELQLGISADYLGLESHNGHSSATEIPADFNFIHVTETLPTPFLDLPFDYGGSQQAFVQSLLDTDDGGRVDSWFDHAYPVGLVPGAVNGRLVLYTGREYGGTPHYMGENVVCYGEAGGRRCYDGHNGIDFSRPDPVQEPWPVLSAADGVVKYREISDKGYGNNVVLYHSIDQGNGYFSRYAHLQGISVTVNTTVTVGSTLGMAGNTGNGDGFHLHFEVYRDNGDQEWEPSEDKLVDPYGWDEDRGGADPWVQGGGPTSHYLWIHQLPTQDPVSGNQGATMTDTTGHIEATIPPDAFSGQAILELSPGPVAGSSAQMRNSGRSFWLRLLEWLSGGGGLQSATTLQSTTQFTLTKPITFTVAYTDTNLLHLDESQLALHRWDEDQEAWHPLTTTVDTVQNIVVAQTQDLGDFNLQAPLLCATDDLEPDDGYAAARWVWPNDWPLARGLDIPQDSDWVSFQAVQGVTYTSSTQNLVGGADTVLNLYDVDALTLLASNDDADGGPASELVWTAPYTGTFFVETVSAPGGTTDCAATYELTIATILGDVIADCRVDIADIMQVASHWRLNAANPDPDDDPTTPNYETRYDLDKGGDIDIVDIMLVVVHWGETCG